MPRCPGCFVMLTASNFNGINVRTCNSCFGTWISRVSLMHIVRNIDPPPAGPDTPTLKDLAALVAEGQHNRAFACPECRHQMSIERLHPIIPVAIQYCGKCRYAWLDVGKLALIQRLYHALLGSTDPKIIQLRDHHSLTSLGSESRQDHPSPVKSTVAAGTGGAMGFPTVSGGISLDALVGMLEV